AAPDTPAESEPAAEEPVAEEGHLGLVWHSSVDMDRVNQPVDTQPVRDGGDGLETRIDMVIYADTSESGRLADECAEAIAWSSDPDATHCLMFQWAIDVPVDYRAEDAGLTPGP